MAIVAAFGVSGVCVADGPCSIALPACAADVAPPGGDGQINVDDLLAVITAWGQSGPPRPAADCAPLPNGDCTVNVNDVLAVIYSWGSCIPPTGACVLPSQVCVVVTHAQCIAQQGFGWAPGATCADADGDRIPNAFELNDCSPPSGGFVGTNPALADTDGDNLKDGDELYGTLGGLNLPALGANPLRKNLFMETDWMADAVGGTPHIHRPPDAAVSLLIAAFAHAPVTNPCGAAGVTLIVDYGQGGAYTGGNLIGNDEVVVFDSEFNAYKAIHFASNRNGYFYYAIHCHRYNTATNGSSGIAELNGDDHIVSLLGAYADVSAVSKTMMHEFGHNLGLRHGGNQDLNYKPNYNSVMNYRYQFPGADGNCNAVGDSILDYSHGVNITLNENALLEAAGVCGSVAIDWNGNAAIDPGPIARNINCGAGGSSDCGVSIPACIDGVCNVLADFNDWAAILFTGLNDGDFAPHEIIECNAPLPSSSRSP